MPVFDTPTPIHATIGLPNGRLQLMTTTRGQTVVDVRPNDPASEADVAAAAAARVEYAGGRLTVEGPRHKFRRIFGGGPSIEVRIELPEGSGLDLQGGSAQLRCAGALGAVRVQLAAGSAVLGTTGTLRATTASGDITVERVSGDVRAGTASGRVHIGEVTGSVVLKAASGGVSLGQVSGEVRLVGASNDIRIERTTGTVDIKIASGNVRIANAVRGSISMQAGSGGLDLGVPEGTAARLDVCSGSGRVHSALPPAAGPEPADQQLEVRVRTGSGDILIHRALIDHHQQI